MGKDALLEVRGLKKHFPIRRSFFGTETEHVKALDGIDFTIYEGEVLGLVGESGSGKTTAGRLAIRLLRPTAGEIFYCGEEIFSLDQASLNSFRQSVQIVFQDPCASLNPRKSVGDSLGEALLYHKKVSDFTEMRAKVREILSIVGLSETAINRYPHEFSGGQQQRICIGRALVVQPRLLILDEAVSALDVSIQAQILNLLGELKSELGLSYLFISHDLSVVHYLCDRVAVIHQGKIVETQEVDTLFENPQDPYTKRLLSAIPVSHPRERKQ